MSGKISVTLHIRLSSVVRSIVFYMPLLSTCQGKGGGWDGKPDMYNKLQGTSTYLQKKQNNHSGMKRPQTIHFFCVSWHR